MKLFFETSAQGSIFLMMLPVGMLLAICVDLCGLSGTFRPLWDLCAVLVCFAAIGFGIVLLDDTSLRMYHVLAVLTGYLLYALGVRRLLQTLRHRLAKKDRHAGRKTGEGVE